jgi:heptosyltransferase II
MHLGSALNKYLLAIYGPTSPSYTPPFGDNAKIIQHKIACSPCFKETCPLQHHQCMRAITPAKILATLAADGW